MYVYIFKLFYIKCDIFVNMYLIIFFCINKKISFGICFFVVKYLYICKLMYLLMYIYVLYDLGIFWVYMCLICRFFNFWDSLKYSRYAAQILLELVKLIKV